MSPSEPAKLPGWAGQVQGLYETFILRDFFGYVFPGGVLLVGAIWMLGYRTPWQWQIDGRLRTWSLILLLISASYACGVFLRLLGAVTPLQLLVIAAARPGLWGDPWRRPVPATGEAEVLEIYRRMLRSDKGARLERLIDRESVFLHLAGNLSLAFVLLAVLVPVGFCSPGGSPMSGKEAVWAAVVLAVAGVILNVGHYEHARAIRLLLEAATPPEDEECG